MPRKRTRRRKAVTPRCQTAAGDWACSGPRKVRSSLQVVLARADASKDDASQVVLRVAAASGGGRHASGRNERVEASVSVAGWYGDPSGRHEHRYFDRERWAEHVSNAGVQSLDPVEAGWPPPAPGALPAEPGACRTRWFRTRGFVVAAVLLLVGLIGGGAFLAAAAIPKPTVKVTVATTAAPTTTVASATTTVKPKLATGPQQVLAWFRAHRDDYRKLGPAVEGANRAAFNGQDLTACDALGPAAGNLELDLPTSSPVLDQAILAGLKRLRDGASTCAQVIVDYSQGNYTANLKDWSILLGQLQGLDDIRSAFERAGLPADVL